MPYALLSMLWISVVGLLVAASSGMKLWGVEHHMRNHVILALTATTLALFAHTMTMFYFIGTAKKIKEFIQTWETEIQSEFRSRITATKRKLFPHMTLICLVVMAAFLMGGAYDSGMVSRPFHIWLAYAALFYHVHVCALETVHILRNINMIFEINDLSRRRFDAQAHATTPAVS